jgi:hypothetical protein
VSENTTKKSTASTSTADKIFPDFKDADDPTSDELSALAQKELDKKRSDWIVSRYQKAKNDVAPIRNQWYINLAFHKGDQYISLLRGKLIRAPQVPGRIRMVLNRIRPTVRTEISRMTSQKPMATVVPASAEDEDIIAAEAGESIWEYVSQVKGFDAAFKQAAFWTSVCGIGYVKTVWDDEAEDKTTTTTDPMTQEETPMEGDFCYTAPTPFHVFVSDLLEQDIQRQPFVLNVYTMTIEDVKDRFADKLDPDIQPTVVGTNEIFETRYLNLVGTESNAKPDSCLVIEAWIKPGATKLFPKGGMAIVVDKTIVYSCDDGLPYNHGEFPFAKIENVPSGSFYSTSAIEDLIPIQKEINRSRSQTVENRNATAKAGYFVQEGSVDVTRWTSKPGQLIPIKPGFKEPVPIPIPQIPAYIQQEHENMLRDWEDISGQHQVSKGSAPTGVTAATAINFLQERDDSFMASVYDSIESATEAVARQTLQLAVQYWDQPRMIKAVGLDQSFSTLMLQGSDIKQGTDIRIDTGTALPTSKAALRAFITDLMNRGMIPADKGLEMLDLPNMRAYYQLVKVDENQAKRENMRMANLPVEEVQMAAQQAQALKQQFLQQYNVDEQTARQDPVTAQLLDKFDKPIFPVNDFDNDDVHIFIHQNFQKSQRYENLDQSIKDQFEKHVQAHKDKQATAQLTQLMQGGQAGGGAPGGGGMPGNGPVAKGPGGGHNVSGNNQFSDGTSGQSSQPVDAGQPQ